MDAGNPRTLARFGLISALYVILTIAFSPVSFGLFQFRVSGMIQPLGLKSRGYAFAIAVGTLLANLFSPLGPIDWMLMPIVSFISAEVARRCFGNTWRGSTLFSFGISLGVSVVLHTAIGIPIIGGFIYIFIPVLATNLIGRSVLNRLPVTF